MGRAPAARGARGGGLPRRVVPRPQPRPGRRPGPAQPHAARADLPHPRRVLRRRRRHRDDEHVHGDDDRPGRLRARRRGRRGDEPRGRAARARCRGRVGGEDRQPALRRRLGRAAQRLAVAVPEGRRPRLPRRDVRRGRRGVRAPDPGAARGRRRPAPDRDRLRHAEREGGDRRRAGRRAGAAALALVHRRRQERPQPVGPDRRGVLDLGRARRAARRRRQLLARSRRDAPVRRGPRGDGPDLGRVLSRTRACRTSSACTTSSRRTRAASSASSRATGSSTSSAAAAGRRRSTSGRSRPRSRASRRAAVPEPRVRNPLQRPRAARAPRGLQLHDDRRADEHHRLGPLPAARRVAATSRRRSTSRSSRCAAGPTSST